MTGNMLNGDSYVQIYGHPAHTREGTFTKIFFYFRNLRKKACKRDYNKEKKRY